MEIHIEVTPRQLPNGLVAWTATIRVPLEGPMSGKSTFSAKAATIAPALAPHRQAAKADAVDKAASLVEQLASNPIVTALMPPGTAAAVQLTKEVAKAYKDGTIQHVVEKYGGIASGAYQQIARLSHVLHF